jgi:predicted metal-binding membrane protein
MTAPRVLERALRRERWLVASSLLLVAALAWACLLWMAATMPGMSLSLHDLLAMPVQAWDAAYFLMIFLMWAVMMVGMMLPAAAPAVLIFTRVLQNRPDSPHPVMRSYLFAAGYLLVWVLFSLVASLAQWRVETALFRQPALAMHASLAGGMLLLAAGLYQLTPAKDACLRQCRSPLDFVSRHWRRGNGGALSMGAGHGLYCLGCCWLLMGVLFAVGVMNLLWVAAISIFVLLEKLLPPGVPVARTGGVLLLMAGGFVVAGF